MTVLKYTLIHGHRRQLQCVYSNLTVSPVATWARHSEPLTAVSLASHRLASLIHSLKYKIINQSIISVKYKIPYLSLKLNLFEYYTTL